MWRQLPLEIKTLCPFQLDIHMFYNSKTSKSLLPSMFTENNINVSFIKSM